MFVRAKAVGSVSMNRTKGFTLVELMLALGIIGMGLLALMKWNQVQSRRNAVVSEQRLLSLCVREFLLFYQKHLACDWSGTWYAWREGDSQERKFTREQPQVWDFRLVVEDKGTGYNIRFFNHKTRGVCLWTWWVYKRMGDGSGDFLED